MSQVWVPLPAFSCFLHPHTELPQQASPGSMPPRWTLCPRPSVLPWLPIARLRQPMLSRENGRSCVVPNSCIGGEPCQAPVL